MLNIAQRGMVHQRGFDIARAMPPVGSGCMVADVPLGSGANMRSLRRYSGRGSAGKCAGGDSA